MKTIFIIQGYEIKTPEGNLVDNVNIEIYANTEKEAIDKAKKYIKKSNYRVSNIIEKI
jgi:hypothetical protein